MSCLISVFDAGREGAAILDTLAPWCACESCESSPYGPIHPKETLVRLLVAPHHFDSKKQVVVVGALTHAENMGMSIYRDDFATDDEMISAAKVLIGDRRDQDPTAGIHGVLLFKAGAVKWPMLPTDGRSGYCMAGTPLQNRPSHMDVYMRVATAGLTKAPVRRQLYDMIKLGFHRLADYRGGILLPYAAHGAP